MWQMQKMESLLKLLPELIPLLVLKDAEARILLEATRYRQTHVSRGLQPAPSVLAKLDDLHRRMLVARSGRK
jgi:hypothetical protein